ncbi:MAG: hypothetical protein DYG90_01965 [Chloroflexi bacterium CFX6]|nr:hypothetical protein [Chloroflexi bacterium CFX6]
MAVLAGVAMAVPTPTLAQPGCGNVALRSPYRGEVVQGAVAILGSARIERFQFYKLEWAPVDDGERWSAVSDTVDQPMVNGLLDMWDTTGLPDGAYRLKLTVVDTDYQERCRVTVENVVVANIGTPAATETPTATVTPEPSAAPTDMPTDMPTDAPAEITAGAPDAAATAVERAGDDGGEAGSPGGRGERADLIWLRERTRLLGGRLTVVAHASGTTLRAEIPLPPSGQRPPEAVDV